MQPCTSKRLLFRITKPPYGSSLAREALDAVLAAAVFEQDVSLLLCGDALYQLISAQAPELIQQKRYTDAFGLFPLYGITNVYVEASALNARGLSVDELTLPVKPLNTTELQQLYRNQDQILSF